MSKALLFLDVDGPLNPYDAPAHRRPDGYGTIYLTLDNRVSTKRSKGSLRVWLNKSHGADIAALADLGYVPTWATKWNDLANDVICDYYGVEPYPVAAVDDAPEVGCVGYGWGIHRKGCNCLHSKTKTLLDYADGRPFVWVDDESTKSDVDWLAANATQPHLVLTVSPVTGLTPDHFTTLTNWIKNLNND